MADLHIPLNDKGFNLSFTVQDDDGTAHNLSGYTITMKVWRRGSKGDPIVLGACVIDVAASGTCHYVVIAGDFDEEGDYLVELELTKTGIIESTRRYTLKVEESP